MKTKTQTKPAAKSATAKSAAAKSAAAKPATAKPAAAKTTAKTTAPANDSKAVLTAPDNATLNRIFTAWPTPTELQETAYRSQFSDEMCLTQGGRTRSTLVVREAGAWAVIIDKTLASPLAADIRYTATRFGFYLEMLATLRGATQAQTGARGTAQGVRSGAERALVVAQKQDGLLGQIMGSVATGRETELGDLATARSTAVAGAADGSPESVAARLQATADLAAQWVDVTDPVWRVLLDEFGLTKEVVTTAGEAARALSAAQTGARGERSQPRDTPAVNVVEGRVLMEMRTVQRAFDVAHDKNPAVPRLIPGRGTRAVLGTNHHTPAAPAASPPTQGAATDVATTALAAPKPAKKKRKSRRH